MNKLSGFNHAVSFKFFERDSYDVDNYAGQCSVKCFAHLRVFYELCNWMILLSS